MILGRVNCCVGLGKLLRSGTSAAQLFFWLFDWILSLSENVIAVAMSSLESTVGVNMFVDDCQ